ncbi:phage holin family protein [Demequina sp. SYSU T00192]|uniref:Phage holin family protein n=1 Tax=Demequina litoralis TaxID=3051660 RepID=A0ABT8G9M4_9MICO|nr:phage holin family protein [Demequina sp. SYSU T00192]MDN4475845.1 phage holin family protein [Demequina sp. SYSU T00192]
MVRFLINTLIFLGSAALGLWITSLVLDGFQIDFLALITAAVIFTVAQWILSPLIFKMATKYANAFLGGVGLVSTFVALLITSLVVDSLTIDGVGTWIAATVLVWLITALCTWLLPMFLLKEAADKK